MSLGALEGFVVGVTDDRRGTEQAESLRRLGASVLHGPAVSTEDVVDNAAWGAADGLADVLEVPVHRCRPPDDTGPALQLVEAVCDGRVDAVTFTSAAAVHNLLAVARGHGLDAALLDACNRRGVVVACIGPVCAEGARREGIERPCAPAQGGLGLLVHVLTEALRPRRRQLAPAGVPVVVQGRALAVGDRVIDLPDRERAVLEVLLHRRGAVVHRAALLRALGPEGASARALEATVARLRRRLGPAGGAVRTVRGRGYVLDS